MNPPGEATFRAYFYTMNAIVGSQARSYPSDSDPRHHAGEVLKRSDRPDTDPPPGFTKQNGGNKQPGKGSGSSDEEPDGGKEESGSGSGGAGDDDGGKLGERVFGNGPYWNFPRYEDDGYKSANKRAIWVPEMVPRSVNSKEGAARAKAERDNAKAFIRFASMRGTERSVASTAMLRAKAEHVQSGRHKVRADTLKDANPDEGDVGPRNSLNGNMERLSWLTKHREKMEARQEQEEDDEQDSEDTDGDEDEDGD